LIIEELSQNENRININDEIYLNDVVMEKERMEEESKFSQVYKHNKTFMQMVGKK
jgi:hypothetical protein